MSTSHDQDFKCQKTTLENREELHKIWPTDSKLETTHSIPQSFELMVYLWVSCFLKD